VATLRELIEALGPERSKLASNAIVLADAHFALTAGFSNVMNIPSSEWSAERGALGARALELLEAWLPNVDRKTLDQLRVRVADRKTPIDLNVRANAIATKRKAGDAKWLATNAEVIPAALADLIDADPDNLATYRILADALIDAGDPRGELIAEQLAGRDPMKLAPNKKRFLGPLSKFIGEPWKTTLTWRAGFIRSAKLGIWDPADDAAKGRVAELAELLLRHPSARFLVELSIGEIGTVGSRDDLEGVAAVIAKQAPRSLRRLHLGDFAYPRDSEISDYAIGNVSEVSRLPQLRELVIQGAYIELGTLGLPALERLEVRTGGLPVETARQIADAELPAVRHLELWFGRPDYGGTAAPEDIAPLLARTDLPQLETLALRNSEQADQLCERLIRAPLFQQIRRLDLSLGCLTSAGVATLVQHGLAQLTELDVSANYLTASDVARLRALPPKLRAADQKTEHEGYRYASVGE
jgi:hypothetical protein